MFTYTRVHIYKQPRYQKQVGWLVLRLAAFTLGETPVLILYEAEWTPGSVQRGRVNQKQNILTPSIRLPRNPKRVIVQWVGIETNKQFQSGIMDEDKDTKLQ